MNMTAMMTLTKDEWMMSTKMMMLSKMMRIMMMMGRYQ